MIRIASIVEGHAEVEAVPVLLRRLAGTDPRQQSVEVLRPIRVARDRFLNKADEFRRQLILAAAKCGAGGWVLVLLDADDDCPAKLAPEITRRAAVHVAGCHLSVVLATREFEAWFIASATALDGVRGFEVRAGDAAVAAESPRDAKGWISQRMPGGTYREVLDQPAFTSRIDIAMAGQRSRSFRKLCKEWTLYAGGAVA